MVWRIWEYWRTRKITSLRATTTRWFRMSFSTARTGGTSSGSHRWARCSSSARGSSRTSTFRSTWRSLSCTSWCSSRSRATWCRAPSTSSTSSWRHSVSAVTSISSYFARSLWRSFLRRHCIRMFGLINCHKYLKTIMSSIKRSLS